MSRGTICAACNNSLVELVSDADFQALNKSHSSNNNLNSGRSDDKKYDNRGGKKDQHSSSRTSRGSCH